MTHIKGPIVEETHYYPFGLTMAAISSKAAGGMENKKNKFQNQELNSDFDVDYYEFKWRSHDPQIGRFIQIDPLSEKYVYNSTYAFSENKVVAHRELEGLEAVEVNQSFIREDGKWVPGAGSINTVDNPNKLGNGVLYHYTYWNDDGNGKTTPSSIHFYVPIKPAKKGFLSGCSAVKLPQVMVFGSGRGGTNNGGEPDYTRPIATFDFSEFSEIIGGFMPSFGDIGIKNMEHGPELASKIMEAVTKKISEQKPDGTPQRPDKF